MSALATVGMAAPSASAGSGGVDETLATRLFIAVSILLLFAMLAGRLASGKRSLPALKQLFGTGFIFLGAGIALGPHGVGLVSQAMMPRLLPVSVFCLGWVAFIVGMQCEFRLVARVAPRISIFALGQSTLSVLLVGAPVLLWGGMLLGPSATGGDIALAALALGCCAGVSSQALPVLFNERLSRQDRSLLAVATGLEDILILAVAILILACAGYGGDILSPGIALSRMVATLLLGITLGYAFFFFLRDRLTSAEILTIGLGVVTLGAGAGNYLHLSAAGLCFFAGVVFVNSPLPRKETFYRVLLNAERPIVFLLFLLAGAFLDLARLERWMVLLPIAYAVLRFASKVVSARVMVPVVEQPMADAHAAVGKDPAKTRLVNPWIGLGLVSSGPLAVVIALDYYLVAQSEASHLVLWTVVMGVLIGEMFVPTAARLLPRRRKPKSGARRAVEDTLTRLPKFKTSSSSAGLKQVPGSSGGNGH